jgi:TolB-like protein
VLRSLQTLGVSLAPSIAAATSGAVSNSSTTASTPAPQSAEHAIERGALAVLPFDNISPDQETDYFSDGLTEELIARLSLVREIELVSRWATMQYKGRVQDIRAVGNELGARYIAGGSVRRFHESVRITVQLVDVATNRRSGATRTRANSTTSSTSRNRSRSRSSRRSSSSSASLSRFR